MAEDALVTQGSYGSPAASSYRLKGDPGQVLLEFLDRIELLVTDALRLPGTSRAFIDRLALLDLVDQLRVAVSDEIQEARDILLERDEILAQAQSDAEQLGARAQQQVESRINESDILEAAQGRARQMLAAAAQEAGKTRREADVYVLEVLQRLEEELTADLNTVRGGIRALQEDLQLYASRFPQADPPTEGRRE